MKFAQSTIAIMAAAFSAPAMADFDVYKVNTYGTGATSESWSIFSGPPDCDQVPSPLAGQWLHCTGFKTTP